MSSNMKKGLSLITSLAVAFVMCLGGIGVFTSIVFAEGETMPDLIVSYDADDDANDVETPFFLDGGQLYYLDQQGTKQYLDNVSVDFYSCVNKKGNADNVEGAAGPDVLDIITAAGIDCSGFNSQIITFIPSDGPAKKVVFTWNYLFGKERYVFPNAQRAGGDQGAAVKDEELEGMEPVQTIININNENQLSFGQVSPSERNKPGFSKNMLVADGTKIPTIEIVDGPAQAIENPTKDNISIPDGSDIELGTEIYFGGDSNNLIPEEGMMYFTTDGSTPDQFSDLYNWLCNKSPYSYHPAVADKIGEFTVKTRVIAFGYKKSAVQTFTYNVSANLSKNGTVTLKNTKFAAGTKPVPTVKVGDLKLDPAKDYRVVYSGYAKVGQAKLAVMGKGDVDGSKTAQYTVIPAKAAISKATAGKKNVTITIKDQKTSGVTGYQIAYKESTAKKWKTVKVTSTKKVIKSLKSTKKYNFKVRANGPTGYGAYSAVKTVKVK